MVCVQIWWMIFFNKHVNMLMPFYLHVKAVSKLHVYNPRKVTIQPKHWLLPESSWHSTFFLLVPHDMWDLVPWPGIGPMPTALGSRGLNHRTTREVPRGITLKAESILWPVVERGSHRDSKLEKHLTHCFWCEDGRNHWRRKMRALTSWERPLAEAGKETEFCQQ